MKLLIVDDNEIFLESLALLMKFNKYEYRFATSGSEALRKAVRFKPDLAVLDIKMPGFDGVEVCRQIKKNPELKDTYVIILSALDGAYDKQRAMSAGADEYLVKPYSPAEVISKIKQLKVAA